MAKVQPIESAKFMNRLTGIRIAIGTVTLIILSSQVTKAEVVSAKKRLSVHQNNLAFANQPFSDTEVAKRLKELPGWRLKEQQLFCSMQFQNFVEAIAFINQLVEPAEKIAHHPDLTISYNQVELSLFTHDANGLTKLDFDLAETITQLPKFPGCKPGE